MTEKLLSYYKVKGFSSLLVCFAFIICSVITFICYIGVDFTFGLLNCVHYALVIVFTEGGVLGCRWGNWGLCGVFAAYLCLCGGGNEGPLIYYTPDYGEIWGLCFR